MHERMQALVGAKTYRVIAEMTGQNAETVRRYMLGADPSVEFLAALCLATGSNAEWLLTGRGPMRRSAAQAQVLQEASAGELLGAMAKTLERLASRVERVEVYAQTLETRIRAMASAEVVVGGGGWALGHVTPAPAAVHHAGRNHEQVQADVEIAEPKPTAFTDRESDSAAPSGAPDGHPRARSVADALAQRPRADAS